MAHIPREGATHYPQAIYESNQTRRSYTVGVQVSVRRVPTDVPVFRVRSGYDGSSIVLSACRYYADTKLDDARPRQERKDHRGHGIPILQSEHRLRRSGNLHTDQGRGYILLRQVREAHRIRRFYEAEDQKESFQAPHRSPFTRRIGQSAQHKAHHNSKTQGMACPFWEHAPRRSGATHPRGMVVGGLYGNSNNFAHYSLSAVSES